MSSFIFDNFKKRFLTGGVPKSDSWHFIPVNDTFKTLYEHDDVKLYHYRNINDFTQANSAVFNFNLTPEAKQFNNELTEKYSVKGLKGISLDDKKCWQPDAIYGTGVLAGNKVYRTWSKVTDDNDLSNKPMYIKGKNVNRFYSVYGKNVTDNTAISSYIESGGFYYIRSKDELTWFANRANTGNNKIIGVLGDNIEGVINGDPIGKDEANPYQGILDGNGFTLKNISVECNNVDNGLVGVLGKYGTVRNFNIDNSNSVDTLVCKKPINLRHIKEDARDINAGILVGRNYGKIENINALNMKYFKFNGFVPEVYSVTNKSDDYTWTDGKIRKKFDTSNSNYYLMNSFCVNSPGNICPYIGYFAEGYYGEDHFAAGRLLFAASGNRAIPVIPSYDTVMGSNNVWNTQIPISMDCKIWNRAGHNPIQCDSDVLTAFNYYILNDATIVDDLNVETTDWHSYVLGNIFGVLTASQPIVKSAISVKSDKTIFNMASKMAKLPVYYGLDNKGYYTCGLIADANRNVSSTNLCYNTNLIQDTLGLQPTDDFSDVICPSAYVQTSLRMNPIARAAYNIGIIAGANYGTISNVAIKVTAQNTSNFVGFYGTIAGKQANGYINMVNVDVDNQFIWDGEDNSYNVTYKNTPILPQTIKNQFSVVKLSNQDVIANSNLDYYFSAFYDTDETVNTATDITDDCVTYRLRPIIVAGGLFGRYIPTINMEVKPGQNYVSNEGCYINGATVIYSDNYEATNWINSAYVGNYKRLESTMGIIAGKCDAGTQSYGVNEDQIMGTNKMFVYNSIFSAVTPTGPVYSALPTSGILTYYGTEASAKKTNASGLSYCADANNKLIQTNCYRRYIGIYELKQNAMETMCVGIDTTGSLVSANEMKTGKDTGLLYTSDYPFRILATTSRSEQGSFYVNHNFSNLVTPGNEGNGGVTLKTGFNKRNIAANLLHLESCRTNISPVVALYDDYVNTWNNVALITPGTTGTTATGYNPTGRNWSCNSNYYTKKAWTSPAIVGSNVTANYISDVYKNASTYTRNLNQQANIDFMEVQAIQNTFDGYTFIRNYGAYGTTNFDANGKPRLRSRYEGWFDGLNRYNNPRIYEKNIMVWSTNQLCPVNYGDYDSQQISGYNFSNTNDIVGVPWLTASTPTDSMAVTDSVLINKTMFNRSRIDDYFYYTYTDSSAKHYSNITPNKLTDSLVQNETVNFGVFDDKMGYYKPVEEDRIKYNYSYYGVGEDLVPTEIRNRLNAEGTFVTTSISSNQNFGGLLVIDSSGNNVMFLDNTNQAPLTGNSISYPTRLADNGKELLMLEVE